MFSFLFYAGNDKKSVKSLKFIHICLRGEDCLTFVRSNTLSHIGKAAAAAVDFGRHEKDTKYAITNNLLNKLMSYFSSPKNICVYGKIKNQTNERMKTNKQAQPVSQRRMPQSGAPK